MKIERISTCIVGNPWKNWVIIRVETDEGVTGIGEATSITSAPMAAEAEEIARFVIGMDPREPLRVAEALDKGTNLSLKTASCGIEIACWDILGKSLGVPVWRLLGRGPRCHSRIYSGR